MVKPAREPAREPPAEKDKGRCVVCGRPRDPKYDPFCSKRCADIDLHRWLKGGYVIPGGKPPSTEGEEEP